MPNRLEDVDAMVSTLKSAVESDLEVDALSRFEICISEALSNLVIHADKRDRETPNDVILSQTTDTILVEIFDPVGGAPFDIRDHAVELSEVAMTAENGRGLGLILECADRVSYGPSKNRNRLALTFLKTAMDAPT